MPRFKTDNLINVWKSSAAFVILMRMNVPEHSREQIMKSLSL